MRSYRGDVAVAMAMEAARAEPHVPTQIWPPPYRTHRYDTWRLSRPFTHQIKIWRSFHHFRSPNRILPAKRRRLQVRIRGGAVPRRRRARALGPGRLRDRRAIRRAVSVRRSARAGMPASPRTVRRGHVAEPAVADSQLQRAPLGVPPRAVSARRGQAAATSFANSAANATPRQPSTEKLSGDRRPPTAAGGLEPRGRASRVPSVVCPVRPGRGRAAPRERIRRHCSRTVNKLW